MTDINRLPTCRKTETHALALLVSSHLLPLFSSAVPHNMNRTQMVPPKTATSVEPNLYNGKASPNAARSIAANHGAPELNMTSPNAAVPIPNKAVPKAAILDTSNAVLYDATASEASNFTIPCAIAPTGLNALAPITVSTVRSDDVRSSKFYYADGGVMVQVQNKLYELDRRTLANVSESFDEAFKSSTNGGWTSWTGSFTRSPVYEVRGIQSQDFERFLETVLRL